MNYCDSLFAISAEQINKNFITSADTQEIVTYKSMQNRVRSMASYLISTGIEPGDVVASHLFNGIEVIVAHMAIQYIGAVSALLDPLVQPAGLDYYLKETNAKLLITHFTENRVPENLKIPVLYSSELTEIFATEPNNSLSLVPVEWEKDETCAIYFTSGSTSKPKGVLLNCENHINAGKIIDLYWKPVDHTSKHICFVPFSHGFGSVYLLPLVIRHCCEMFIMRSFNPIRVLELIETESTTHIYGVPSHYQQLLRFKDNHETLGKLQMAFCAAAKLDISVMEQWKEITGFHLSEGYGLIETATGVTYRVNDLPRGTGHLGICPPKELVEIAICNENGDLLKAEEQGEIVIKGKSVMNGYLNNPEENSNVFRDGWFRSGDRGYISPDNHLFMTGRIKDIINIAGIKISPFEVEAVLNKHEDIQHSIVVAVEDSLYGEVVKAFVQLKPDIEISERDISKFASEHLMSFQVPKRIEFISEFPLNNMGKIDRKSLRTVH